MPTRKCPRPKCHAPEVQCSEGYDDVDSCPHWNANLEQTTSSLVEQSISAGSEGATSVAWSGSALGNDDLAFVAAQRRPRLVALVGPQNAGKTTFLALLYLLVRRGVPFEAGRFAGSYSFGGWEKLAHYMMWEGDSEPTFPPHTAANEGRRPGMLHLAFRKAPTLLEHTLWTDAPGEWFRLWAVDSEDPNAEGARWTYLHSDCFLLFADSEALAGEQRGEAVERLKLLIERLRNKIGGRPVGLVWAKSDIETPVPASVRHQIEGDVKRHFPRHEVFSISVPKNNPDSNAINEFVRVLNWALTSPAQHHASVILPVVRSDDPLFAFRGKN